MLNLEFFGILTFLNRCSCETRKSIRKVGKNSGKVGKNSGKVGKDSGKVGKNSGKVGKNSGKVGNNSGRTREKSGNLAAGMLPQKFKWPTAISRVKFS